MENRTEYVPVASQRLLSTPTCFPGETANPTLLCIIKHDGQATLKSHKEPHSCIKKTAGCLLPISRICIPYCKCFFSLFKVFLQLFVKNIKIIRHFFSI